MKNRDLDAPCGLTLREFRRYSEVDRIVATRYLERAEKAEAALSELARMLDGYRNKNRPMPTYAELSAIAEG